MRKLADYPLWLGHTGDLSDPGMLLELGIAAVVDLALNERPAVLPRELVYCRFPLLDGSGNSHLLLRTAVDTVTCLVRARMPTLICCGAGLSRSPAIAGAAIANLSGCSLADGLLAATREGAHDVSPGLWADIAAAIDLLGRAQRP